MAATLETLPRECLEEILMYLDARDVVAAMATSRAVRQVAGGERVWRELAFRDFGVCEPFGEETAPASTPEGDALEGARWRALHHDVHVQLCKDDDCLKEHGRTTLHDDTPYDARCPPDEMRALRARGVFCDGGVDENDPENWFGQVFELEGAGQRFYCSAASRDVHLVGCFAEGDVHCAWRADSARHARRRFMAAKCSLLAHVLERLSAQSSLAPEDQRDFDTILREARLLPPYDFTGWPHEELGSFFTHYVRQYRPDDPISQLFFDANSENSLFPRDAEWSVPDDGPNAIDALRRIAELHRKDQRLELRLSNYHDPLTHVEPLPEAEHRLFEYLEARQPDNEFVSFDVHNEVRARRERDEASAKRRAETPGRELLDLFAENAAMHAFSDAVVRVDQCELDDELEPEDGPVWRAARRRAEYAEGAEYDENMRLLPPDRFFWEDVEYHAGCYYFTGGEEALRVIAPPPLLGLRPDPCWFVGEPRAETRAAGDGGSGSASAANPRIERDVRVRSFRATEKKKRRRGGASDDDISVAAAPEKADNAKSSLPLTVGVRRWRQVGAVVTCLEIDRTGAFTCPVSSGAVYFSNGPPSRLTASARAELRAAAPAGAPPMSGDARAAALGDWARNAVSSPCAATARLSGIDTLDKLKAAAREGKVPKIIDTQIFPNGVVVEFEPPARRRRDARATSGDSFDASCAYDAFAPAVWFKFFARESLDPATRADPHRDVLRVRLAAPRWSRAHCVKLIAPENLMREWEDDHPAPNLDFRRFAAFGALLALSDHEVGGRAFVSSAEPEVFVRTPGAEYSDDE